MIPVLAVVFLITRALLSFSEALGVPSSLAIIPLACDGGAAALVCTIVFKNATRSIECSKVTTVGVGEAFPIYPAISFASLAGGGDSLCGLQFDGTAFFCWRQTGNCSDANFVPGRRVYKNDTVPLPLRELVVVRESLVAATDRSGTFVQWWGADGNDFPSKLRGNFSSLTSGADFVCAVASNDDSAVVDCWGARGPQIKADFANREMSSIVASDFRACGVEENGRLLCSGSSLMRRQPKSFEFSSLALGTLDTCVLRSNKTAVCWRAGGEEEYSPGKDSSFVFLLAGRNLFCGLTMNEYDIHCWWSNQSSSQPIKLPMQMIVPGICTPKSSCQCDFLPGSSSYCPNSDVVCYPCPHSWHPSRWSEERIQWLVIGCVAFAASLLAIWAQWRICKELLTSCLPHRPPP